MREDPACAGEHDAPVESADLDPVILMQTDVEVGTRRTCQRCRRRLLPADTPAESPAIASEAGGICERCKWDMSRIQEALDADPESDPGDRSGTTRPEFVDERSAQEAAGPSNPAVPEPTARPMSLTFSGDFIVDCLEADEGGAGPTSGATGSEQRTAAEDDAVSMLQLRDEAEALPDLRALDSAELERDMDEDCDIEDDPAALWSALGA